MGTLMFLGVFFNRSTQYSWSLLTKTFLLLYIILYVDLVVPNNTNLGEVMVKNIEASNKEK